MASYNETMKLKQRQSDECIRKAERTDSLEEKCLLWSQASQLEYDMAKMSLGAEKIYHQAQVRDLKQKFLSAMQKINPEQYQDYLSRANAQNKEQQIHQTDEMKASATQDSEEEDIEIDSSKWLKEAPKHSFDDVSGMDDLKEKLRACALDTRRDKLKSYLKMKKLTSYFFVGPPGVGKTYIIEAFAHELMDKNYKYFSVVGADLLSQYVGLTEKAIEKLFDEVQKNAPCILFIDEIDALCKNRSLPNIHDYTADQTTAFLTGYNRINKTEKPIIFIGATNYPDQVDNAMLDRVEIICVDYPDKEARRFAFTQQFNNLVALEECFTFEQMAKETENSMNHYNYRDIERLSTEMKTLLIDDILEKYNDDEDAAIEALKSGEYVLTKELFNQAKENYNPTPKQDIDEAIADWMTNWEHEHR